MFLWNSLGFSMIQWMLAIWSLVPLPLLNGACPSRTSWFMYCWSLMVFPSFFNLSLNFAVRSLWSEPQSAPSLCFCWLYRASPSLAAKNIIDLISVLTIWWCPCVQLSFVWLEEGFLLWSVHSLGKTVSLCPASFCTPRPNLPVTPGVSWLSIF